MVRHDRRGAGIAAMAGAMAGILLVLFVLDDGERRAALEQLDGGPFGPEDDKQAAVINMLRAQNVLAQAAVESFPTTGQEGLQDPLSCVFHTEIDGHRLAAEKDLDEDSKFEDQHTKEQISDLNESNDDAERYTNMIATVEDVQNDQDMNERSSRWEAHRQSLQDEVDYEDKLSNQRDDEGDLLKEDIKRSSAYVDEIGQQEEGANRVEEARNSHDLESRQAELAAAIVGLPDPLAPSEDETALLRQNDIVSNVQRISNMSDDLRMQSTKCVDGMLYEGGECP
eukprot:754963-Hanusia_phi.AAC.2